MIDKKGLQQIFPVLPEVTFETRGSEVLVKTDPYRLGLFMSRFQDLHFRLNGRSSHFRDFYDVLDKLEMNAEELKSVLYPSIEECLQMPVCARADVLKKCKDWGDLFAAYNLSRDYSAFKEGARLISKKALDANKFANHNLFLGGRAELVDHFRGRYGMSFDIHNLTEVVNHEMEHFNACLAAARAIGREEELSPWLGVMFALGPNSFDMSYCYSFFEREVREDKISEQEFNTYRQIAFEEPANPSDGDKLMLEATKKVV